MKHHLNKNLYSEKSDYGPLIHYFVCFVPRLERLDHLLKKFQHKCNIHEAWSDGKEDQLKDNDFSNTPLNELRVSRNLKGDTRLSYIKLCS